MIEPPIDAVVVGTKGFAVALLAPLAQRVGGRPRIAQDAGHALALCARSARGLVVVEVVDAATLGAVERMARIAGEVRVVAALPLAHAGAEGALRSLGVEPVRWDGHPGPVLDAIGRRLAAAPGAPLPRPAAAPVPPVSPAAPARAAPPPAAPPAARPAPPPAAPRPSAAEALLADALDAPDSAGEDVELDFDGPGVADPFAGAGVAQAGGAPGDPGALWPADVLDAVSAEAALAASLAGTLSSDAPYASVVERVLAAASDLERAVLFGDAQPFETGPVRRAVVMRLRVAVALATAPPPGTASDAAAASSILAEIDGLLSDVSALATSAPAERQPQLAAIRNALVSEAIDLSESMQRTAVGAEPAPPPTAAPAPARAARRVAAARVLSVDAAEAPRRRVAPWILLGVALLGLAGYHGKQFADRRAAIARLRTLPGAPDGMMLLSVGRSGARVLIPLKGRVPDPAQVERFKAQQIAEGLEVRDLPGGGLEIRRPRANTPRTTP